MVQPEPRRAVAAHMLIFFENLLMTDPVDCIDDFENTLPKVDSKGVVLVNYKIPAAIEPVSNDLD